MWAYDFLAAEPKAKSLKTHLIANNAFARWWVAEYYMPEEMRLSGWLRFGVLVQTLCIYLVVVSLNVVYKDSEYMRECRDRDRCLAGCIEDNFPELPCIVNTDFNINYGGNSYRHIFEWRDKPVDPGEDKVPFEFCRATFPTPGKTKETNERELFMDERQPRTQVCFPYCMPVVADLLYLRNWTDKRTNTQVVDTRPDEGSPECEASGKKTSLLCVDPNPEIEYCEKLEYENEWCAEKYIPWVHSLEGANDPACLHPLIVLLSCLLSIPFQNLFDLILIFTLATVPESIQDFRANALRCSSQCAHLLSCSVLVLLLTSSVYNVFDSSRPHLMWFTWGVVVGIDHVRNIIVQAFVWYFLIRRCGQVPLMDESEVYRPADDANEKLTPTQVFFRLIAMLVESRRFNLATWVAISLYAVYLITVMSIDEYLTDGARAALEDGDTAFLVFFILEIILRMLADMWYLKDFWNIFDASVIWVSFAFKFQTTESGSQLALLRLLRLLRLVLVLRKVSATKKPKTGIESGVTFSSPVERVLEIFREIKESKGMPQHLKDQIDWASDVISSNKLYSISVDLDKIKSGEGFLDQEVSDWVRLACDNAGEKTTWREVELEKLLSGRGTKKATREELVGLARRCVSDELQEVVNRTNLQLSDLETDGKAMVRQGEDGDKKTRRHKKEEHDPVIVAEMVFDYLDSEVENWAFDMHAFERWTGDKAMPLVVMQSLVRHELYDIFEILPDAMRDFLHAIEKGYHKKNPFHNATHGGDVVQAFNVLFVWLRGSAEENSVLQEQELLAGLLAACIHDFEHPGFNNNFIIRTKHPMGLRYNDLSVLENHHVSSGFSVMMSLSQDPLGHCTEAQYREIRKMMISMVLATDIAHHFSELSSFKNKLNTKSFPSAKGEDKQIVMDMMLHTADISNAARCLRTYALWVPRVMEEFFRQGDVELETGMQVSMFYDRTTTSIPQCQKGFIEVFVLPTYSVLGQLIPEINAECIPNLEANHAYFCKQLGGTQAGSEQKAKRATRSWKYAEKVAGRISRATKVVSGGAGSIKTRLHSLTRRNRVAQIKKEP